MVMTVRTMLLAMALAYIAIIQAIGLSAAPPQDGGIHAKDGRPTSAITLPSAGGGGDEASGPWPVK